MFFVDEKFYKSGPVVAIPRAHRIAAVGLWTLAGTWSREFLKDGFVPAHMIEELGGTIELADMLVDVAKLWRRRGGGYQFNDWAKWQDTRASVEKKRAAWRDRQNRHRGADPENTGDDPPSVTRESPHPRPRPLPLKTTDDNGRPPASHKSGSPQVDNSGDYPAVIAAATERLTTMNGGIELPTGAGAVVVDRILERGGARVRNPMRYVQRVITDHGLEWLAFIHTDKEPS